MMMSNVLWGCQMFYGDVKSAWKPLEMQAWLTKQSKQALSVPTHQSWFVHLCVFLCLNILSFALFSAVLYYPVISCTILWYPVLSCTILYYPILSSTILFYPELFPTIIYTKSLQLCCFCCWHSGLGVGRTLFSLCIQRRFHFFFFFFRHVHSSWKLWKIGNPVSDICLKSFDKYLVDCHQRAHMYHWWCRTGSQVGPRVPIFHISAKLLFWMRHHCWWGQHEQHQGWSLHWLHKFKLVRNGQKLPAGRCHSPLVIW